MNVRWCHLECFLSPVSSNCNSERVHNLSNWLSVWITRIFHKHLSHLLTKSSSRKSNWNLGFIFSSHSSVVADGEWETNRAAAKGSLSNYIFSWDLRWFWEWKAFQTKHKLGRHIVWLRARRGGGGRFSLLPYYKKEPPVLVSVVTDV